MLSDSKFNALLYPIMVLLLFSIDLYNDCVPTAVFDSPVTLFCIEFDPNEVFRLPLILFKRDDVPIAVLYSPVVLFRSVFPPTPTL